MYLCAQNHDLKRGGTFETAKAGTFHSVTAGTLIPLSPNRYRKTSVQTSKSARLFLISQQLSCH